MVSKYVQTNVEIAGFNIPYTFLVGKIAPNCILRSSFLTKTAAEVYFKANELFLNQRDKIGTAPVREVTCNKEEKIRIKSRKLSLKMLDD